MNVMEAVVLVAEYRIYLKAKYVRKDEFYAITNGL